MSDNRVWNFGYGPVLCPKHLCPMTTYGGCQKCNAEVLDETIPLLRDEDNPSFLEAEYVV